MPQFPNLPTPRYSAKSNRFNGKVNTQNVIHSESVEKVTNSSLKESDSLDIKLGEISSSSSLSWSDEFESESTKKIYEKLQRIDRVLKQQEPIAPHFDKEEFHLWMRNFPTISIFDQKSCDKEVLGRNVSGKHTHSAVINHSEFSHNRLLTQRSGNTRKRHFDDFNNKKNIFTISNKPKNLDTETFLKIAPIKKHTERKLSTKSLSKEYDFPQSLPFIEIDENFSENKKPSSNTIRNKYLNNKDILILPPIQGDKLRSISATPSQDTTSKLFLL